MKPENFWQNGGLAITVMRLKTGPKKVSGQIRVPADFVRAKPGDSTMKLKRIVALPGFSDSMNNLKIKMFR